jgi:hypothetical protein
MEEMFRWEYEAKPWSLENVPDVLRDKVFILNGSLDQSEEHFQSNKNQRIHSAAMFNTSWRWISDMNLPDPTEEKYLSRVLPVELATYHCALLFSTYTDTSPLVHELLKANGTIRFKELFSELLLNYSRSLQSVAGTVLEGHIAQLVFIGRSPIAAKIVLLHNRPRDREYLKG